MFNTLIARDFKRHKALEMAFEPGLNLLIGPNYTGKSSVLHAILYALWGASAVPGGKAVVQRKGSDGKPYVKLSFSLNSGEYEIERDGTKATITKDGSVVAKSTSAVNKYIEELLGLSRARFLQLKHGAQKETEALLTLGVGELHKVIEEVSGAALVTDVMGKASAAASEAKGGLAALPEVDLQTAKAKETELVKRLQAMATKIDGLKAQKEAAQSQSEKAEQALAEAMDLYTKVEAAHRERGRLEKEHEQMVELVETTSADLAAMQGVEEQLRDAKLERDAAVEELTKHQAEFRSLAAAKRAVEVLTNRVAQTQGLVDKSLTALPAAPEHEDELPLQEALGVANARFQAAKQKRNEINESLKNGVCPSCLRPFEGYDIAALEKKQEEVVAEVAAASEELAAARDNLDRVKKNNTLRADIERRLESDQAVLTQQKEDLARSQSELDKYSMSDDPEGDEITLKGKVESWTERCDKLQRQAADQASLEKAYNRALARVEALEGELGNFTDLPDLPDTGPLRQALQDAQKTLHEVSNLLTYEQGSYAGEYNTWGMAKNAREAAENVEAQRTALESRAAGIDGLIKYLRKNRDRFLSSIWDGIMSYASNFAAACTDGTIERILRNDNGTFAYHEGGEVHPVEAASGAQRSIMGLGVQLALAQMLPSPLSALLLDEPTADLDPERSLAMSALLSAESNQLLMVSHRELDGAAAATVFDMGVAA